MTAGTELAAPPEAPQTGVARRDRDAFDSKSIALIKSTVAKGATDAEQMMFLELAARYDLDPFAKEIWCAKTPGKNGSAGSVMIIVARDGLLKIANRDPLFRGLVGDVVRANDQFIKEQGADGEVRVTHNVQGTPEKRGAIVGAWAVVHRTGKLPTYFYAPIEEYRPKSEAKRNYSPWGAQESAMILKCAEAMALRKAFSISGVVGEGEEYRALQTPSVAPVASDDGVPTDLPADLIARCRADLQAARDCGLDPWRPAKVRATLITLDEEQIREWLAELEMAIAAAGGTVPEPPTLADEEPEPEVVDAEVVPDADGAEEPPEDAEQPAEDEQPADEPDAEQPAEDAAEEPGEVPAD